MVVKVAETRSSCGQSVGTASTACIGQQGENCTQTEMTNVLLGLVQSNHFAKGLLSGEDVGSGARVFQFQSSNAAPVSATTKTPQPTVDDDLSIGQPDVRISSSTRSRTHLLMLMLKPLKEVEAGNLQVVDGALFGPKRQALPRVPMATHGNPWDFPWVPMDHVHDCFTPTAR